MRRTLMRLVLSVAIGSLLVIGYTSYRIWEQGGRDEARDADAIVVLGAAQYNGTPSPLFEARLDHAVKLYKDGIAPFFVVTGGKGRPRDTTTEAEAARDYAIAQGVPASKILVEDQSRTTLEQIRIVGQMLRDRGMRSVIIVSDRTHMLRSLRIARDEGIEAYGSPTTTSPAESNVRDQVEATVHEVGALALYFVAGTTP